MHTLTSTKMNRRHWKEAHKLFGSWFHCYGGLLDWSLACLHLFDRKGCLKMFQTGLIITILPGNNLILLKLFLSLLLLPNKLFARCPSYLVVALGEGNMVRKPTTTRQQLINNRGFGGGNRDILMLLVLLQRLDRPQVLAQLSASLLA